MSTEKEHYLGHRARLREKLLRDATLLADYELLELLLGLALTRRDTKPLAKELLHRFRSVRGVLDAHPAELCATSGFGPSTVALWRLLRELMARYAESAVRERELLQTPAQVAAMARVRLAGCPHEEVWAALVDAGNRLLAWIRLDEGTVNASAVHIRKVMEQVILHKACGIILVHNHPGGTAKPSAPDMAMTDRLKHAAHALGVNLLDHFVLTDTTWYSFKNEGLL